MELHELPCLICGKQVGLIYKGQDDPAIYPGMVGGTVDINFGYGSIYDEMNGPRIHQALICDNCFLTVRDRTRTVIATRYVKWEKT